jgi:L-amino acid N-acyltransferase YncA
MPVSRGRALSDRRRAAGEARDEDVKVTSIRSARLADLSAITEIYNEAIRTTTATFDTEPKTESEERHWFESHGPRHPILVAELDGRVVGWACLSKWSDRGAYSETAETSFYVKEEYRGRGIGRKLKEAIVAEGARLGYHCLIARVAEGSEASVHLNESLGFRLVGVLKEVGRKFGRLLDVYIYQKICSAVERTTPVNSEPPHRPDVSDQVR